VISKRFLKNVHNYANYAYYDVTILTCVIISMVDVKVFLMHIYIVLKGFVVKNRLGKHSCKIYSFL